MTDKDHSRNIQSKLNELISLYRSAKYNESLELIQNMDSEQKVDLRIQNLQGLILIGLSRNEDAKRIFQEIIDRHPESAEAYANMGLLERKVGHQYIAQTLYKRAINLSPNVCHLYYNLANVQLEISDYGEAIKNYEKALALKPNFVEGLHNLGVAQNLNSEPSAAKKSFLEAISLRDDYRPSLEELAKFYRDSGEIEASLTTLKKIIRYFPNYVEARVRWLAIAIQTFKIEEINYFKEYDLKGSVDYGLSLHPRYQIYMAIFSLICRNYSDFYDYLERYSELAASEKVKKISPSDLRFCDAFSTLLENHRKNKAPIGKYQQIFHFGESHCLTVANQVLTVNKEKMQVQPRIIFGAKAYHFSTPPPNRFKAITKLALASIPNKSTVLLSFGEIDCRPKEGFIPAALKLSVSVEDVIAKTVQGYVQWFEEMNNLAEHAFYFVGVPAPIYRSNISKALNISVMEAVKEFNSQLQDEVKNTTFKYIDLYTASADESGFSNRQLHIDATHLGLNSKHLFQSQL